MVRIFVGLLESCTPDESWSESSSNGVLAWEVHLHNANYFAAEGLPSPLAPPSPLPLEWLPNITLGVIHNRGEPFVLRPRNHKHLSLRNWKLIMPRHHAVTRSHVRQAPRLKMWYCILRKPMQIQRITRGTVALFLSPLGMRLQGHCMRTQISLTNPSLKNNFRWLLHLNHAMQLLALFLV